MKSLASKIATATIFVEGIFGILFRRWETRGTYRTVSSETSRGIKQNSRYIDALNNILSKYKNIPCYFLSTTANILNKEKMISKK